MLTSQASPAAVLHPSLETGLHANIILSVAHMPLVGGAAGMFLHSADTAPHDFAHVAFAADFDAAHMSRAASSGSVELSHAPVPERHPPQVPSASQAVISAQHCARRQVSQSGPKPNVVGSIEQSRGPEPPAPAAPALPAAPVPPVPLPALPAEPPPAPAAAPAEPPLPVVPPAPPVVDVPAAPAVEPAAPPVVEVVPPVLDVVPPVLDVEPPLLDDVPPVLDVEPAVPSDEPLSLLLQATVRAAKTTAERPTETKLRIVVKPLCVDVPGLRDRFLSGNSGKNASLTRRKGHTVRPPVVGRTTRRSHAFGSSDGIRLDRRPRF